MHPHLSNLRNTLLVLTSLASITAQAQAQPAPANGDLAMRVAAVEDQVIAWRRHIHQSPELSYQEVNTAAYVAQALATMPGIEVQTGIAKTGIKAVLRGARPGPVVALRADMDALPVLERNNLAFRSTTKAAWRGQDSPVAHVCGHDTHTAMLLGAAKVLSGMRDQLPGTVVFLFQPAEELGPGSVPSGATAMVKEGVLRNPKVDIVMGQHINAQAPSGAIGYRRGSLMASGDQFSIVVRGKGGHGAQPWSAKDPILVAAEIAMALQNIVSHQVNPLDGGPSVVTVGSLNGGNRANVIPDSAEITGTIRTLSPKNQKIAQDSLRLKAEKIAESAGLVAEVKIESGYNVLVSDPEATSGILGALDAAAGRGKLIEIPPALASEDFGAFGDGGTPTVFWMLFASPFADRAGPPNHSPEFVIDEKALPVGVQALVGATLAYMNRPKVSLASR